jgi:ParB family chromosome partitioning protein
MASFARATAVVPPVDDRIVHMLPIASIQPSPHNPRRQMDNIDELAQSLRTHGLLQPIVVRRRGGGYELIVGHRRYEAAKLLGWTEIVASVRDETPKQAYVLALVENLQREDLSLKDVAAALEVLVREVGSTHKVAERIKKSAMYVSRRLRVFDDPVLAPLVLRNELPVSTAEELLRESDSDSRRELAEQAVDEQWSQGDARRAVQASRNVTLQPAPRLASRICAPREELAGLDLAALSARARHELVRLVELVNS